jgi:hypothetical protein
MNTSKLPAGAKELIGLGLTFCIQQPMSKPKVKTTMAHLKRSIRIRQHTMNLPKKEEDEYIPSFYVNSSWIPPRAGNTVEQGIIAFENEI